MVERLKLAKSKGCDGVDPDNVDGYANTSGFKMSQADGVDYMKFLSTEAHKLGLAIGLKNAPDIVKNVVDVLQWEVNEQCLEFDDECTKFKPFIDAEKPVFHIEVSHESFRIELGKVFRLLTCCGIVSSRAATISQRHQDSKV